MAKALEHPDWVRRFNLFGDIVGDPRLLASLDADELLATARASTGLDDLGEAEWPGWTETYERMLTAIDGEAQLHTLGRIVTRAEVLKVLQTWLRLQEEWKTQPAIRAEPIDAPLFVVGPPRTGTTILLELLALDPQLRAPIAWEALHPLSSEGSPERRRELSECEQEFWADVHPEFMTMHELASDLPCECVNFLAYDFAGPYYSMMYDTPSFIGWQLENLDTLDRVYRLHRRMLQTFQHGDGIDGRRTAALVAQVARSSVDARRAVRRVSRRARHSHASRPAAVHRVVGEPARGVALHAQRPGRAVDDGPAHGDDVSTVPRAGDRAAHRRHRARRPDRRHALPRSDVGPGRDAAPRVRPARLRLAQGSRPRRSPRTSTPSPRRSTAPTPTPSPISASTTTMCGPRSPAYVAHYGITEE